MELLLEKIKFIINKYEKLDKITGNNFNIFKVCEIQDKEVLICRFIYQLINPDGLHNQSDLFLKKFIKNVLREFVDYDKLNDNEHIEVYKEYKINDDRRIDLLIKSSNYIIPIEVKIYAGDQDTQCNDYIDWASKQGKEYKLFYLTLDGHFPSEYSVKYNKNIQDYENDTEIINELKEKGIYCISFKEEILNWIKDCLLDVNLLNKKRITDNLMQFLDIIKELCGMNNNQQNYEIKELIKTEKDFETLMCLENAMGEIRKHIFLELIEEIVKELKNKKVFDNDGEDYINKPSIDYVFGKVSGSDYLKLYKIDEKFSSNQMYYCIGIGANDDFYVGTYCKDENEVLSKQFFEKHFVNSNEYSKGFPKWPCFKYLEIDGERLSFDKNCIAIAYLLNDDKRTKFIKNVVEELKKLKERVEINK